MGCVGTFKTVDSALEMYVKDHKGKLPPADKWQDEIMQYIGRVPQGEEGFAAPVDLATMKVWGCGDADGKTLTGIAFNSDVGGKVLAKVEQPRDVPLVFETVERGFNLNKSYRPDRGSKPPTLVFGAARGWIEVMAEGSIQMVVNKRGRMIRVEIPGSERLAKTIDELKGREVQQPAAPKR